MDGNTICMRVHGVEKTIVGETHVVIRETFNVKFEEIVGVGSRQGIGHEVVPATKNNSKL